MATRFSPALRALRATAPRRFNSSTSTTRPARIMQMAAQTSRPSPAEAAVPLMWAVCGGLIYTAWNRVEEREDGVVEKVCVVRCAMERGGKVLTGYSF